MRNIPLTININSPIRIGKRVRIHLEEKVVEEVHRTDAETSLIGLTNAYAYFAHTLKLENTVSLEGAPEEELRRIKQCVMRHEVQSPRFTTIKFIEKMSQVEVSGENIVKLVELSRSSIINRFSLYKNVYNLEVLHRNRRRFNYSRILERLWKFHREYKYFLSLLVNITHKLEGQTEIYSKMKPRKKEVLAKIEGVDLYSEIDRVISKVSKNLLEQNKIESTDIKILKGFRMYYGDLVYTAYGIYGHGTHDLLLLFYGLFDKNGNPKSKRALIYLLKSIDLHVRGFSSSIYKLQQNKTTIENLKRKKYKEVTENIEVFLNKDCSVFVYRIVPFMHKLLGSVLLCSLVFCIIRTVQREKEGSNEFFYGDKEQLIFSVFLSVQVFMFLLLIYFIRQNKITVYTKRAYTKWVDRNITDAMWGLVITVSTLLLGIYEVSEAYTHWARLLVGISAGVLVVLVILDQKIRLQPVFSFDTKRRLSAATLYVCVVLGTAILHAL